MGQTVSLDLIRFAKAFKEFWKASNKVVFEMGDDPAECWQVFLWHYDFATKMVEFSESIDKLNRMIMTLVKKL